MEISYQIFGMRMPAYNGQFAAMATVREKRQNVE